MAAKKHNRKPRAKNGLAAKLLTVAAAATAIVVGVMIFFKVQTVTVTGNTRYSAQTVIEASGIELGENLMTLNRTGVGVNVVSRLPYVENARVARQMPDTVLIEVTECEAAAIVTDAAGKLWLLSPAGKVTEQVTEGNAASAAGLTQVIGAVAVAPEAGQLVQFESAEQYTALTTLLVNLERTTLLPEVVSIDLTKTYELILRYGERFDVKLGGTDRLDYKITYLHEIIKNQLDETKTGTIDLTLEEDGTARLIPW